jgi:hypothetical protein
MNCKSKYRLRIAFCFSILWGALAMAASAQPAMTNATALEVPVTNLLVLATVSGKVRVLDSKGLLLESNSVYLPRIKLSDLSSADLHSLLETKKAYVALTSFGPFSEHTAQSAVIENQFRQIWIQGKSLHEKIQTRLELLDEIRAYNADVANLPSLERGANNAANHASWMDDRTVQKNQVAADAANQAGNTEDARVVGAASREQVHQARLESEEANEHAARGDNRDIAANYQSAVASQSLQNYLDACAALSQKLASYGINVPASAPFYPVPPLSMRTEVDAERMATSATVSSTAGQ